MRPQLVVPAIIGRYLERDVVLSCPQDLGGIGRLNLSDATLFVWLGTEPLPDNVGDRLAMATIDSAPSAIVLAGCSAELFFDRLLRTLETAALPLPTMTKFVTGDLTDSLEEFFNATWPSEDRFDIWTRYVVTSQAHDCDLVQQSLESFLRAPRRD